MNSEWQSISRWEARRKMSDYGEILRRISAQHIIRLEYPCMLLAAHALYQDWRGLADMLGMCHAELSLDRSAIQALINKHLGEDHEQD